MEQLGERESGERECREREQAERGQEHCPALAKGATSLRLAGVTNRVIDCKSRGFGVQARGQAMHEMS
jgi:hypothetical protein